MKHISLIFVPSFSVLVLLAMPLCTIAQEGSDVRGRHSKLQYGISDLGTLGGPLSFAYGLNNKGNVGGDASLPDGSTHAFLWTRAKGMQDLGTFDGPNSFAGAPNHRDVMPMALDTSAIDPHNENSCGFGTPFLCGAGIWKDGLIIPLPPLVDNHNAQTTTINNWGVEVGFADNDTPDPSCATGTPTQYFDFEAVLWDRNGDIHELQPLPGDTVGFAIGLNDRGEAVGATGSCSNTPLLPLAIGPHAVLWKKDRTPVQIPGLGGTKSATATSINNRGDVIGESSLPGDKVVHTFLWTNAKGTQDLGTVDGDMSSIPAAMHALNNKGQLVGTSCPSGDPLGDLGKGLCRAYLWDNGVMMDLNALVPAGRNPAQLRLFLGFGINDSEEIAGWAFTTDGFIHAFLATPIARDDHDRNCCDHDKGSPQ